MKNKQQIIADIILKYTLPDALKPQYDGMTAYELAGIILREIKDEVAIEDVPDKYQHLSPEDDIFDHEDEDKSEREAEKEYEKDEIDSHTHRI